MLYNKVQTYTRAFVSALESVPEKKYPEHVARFLIILKKRGDMKLAGKIFQEFGKAWARRGKRALEVISAKQLLEREERVVELFSKEHNFLLTRRIVPEVKGGYALIVNDTTLVDGTIRGKLRKLWQSFRF